MNNDINILRNEIHNSISMADKYFEDGMLGNSCNELKFAIAKAEEIFRLTNSLDDKNVLLELYMKIAKAVNPKSSHHKENCFFFFFSLLMRVH